MTDKAHKDHYQIFQGGGGIVLEILRLGVSVMLSVGGATFY